MKSGNYGKVVVVILDYNEPDETYECLDSLSRVEYSDLHIILIENGCKRENVEKLSINLNKFDDVIIDSNIINDLGQIVEDEEYPGVIHTTDLILNGHKLTILKSKTNLGFTGGNNVIIKWALKKIEPEYFLLLNNDTRIKPDFLKKLVFALECNPNYGISGPKVMNYPKTETIQGMGGLIDLSTSRVEHIITIPEIDECESFKVDFISGCALLVKADLLRQFGLLKKEYIAYWEDSDLCYRFRRNSYYSVCVPNAVIYHRGNFTAKKSDYSAYLFNRNRFFFIRDNNQKYYIIFLIKYISIHFPQDLLYAFRCKQMNIFLKGSWNGLINNRGKK